MSNLRFKKNVPIQIDYPLSQENIDDLHNSVLHSPILTSSSRVTVDMNDIPVPLMPEDGDAYWGELLEVAKRVEYSRRKLKFSEIKDHTDEYLQPKCLDTSKDFVSRFIKQKYGVDTCDKGAELVRSDFPTSIITDLAIWLMQNGVKPRAGILPGVDYIRFTDGVVLLGHLIGWAIHTVSPNAFAVKWHFGRPRPEEVAHAWAKGDIDAPNWFDIQFSDLINRPQVATDAARFTTYSEGAPNHPSYPAMHGAAAGASVLLGVFFDLNAEMLEEVRRTAANIALFRDFAGVHYRQDSLLGLHLGEKIVSENIGAFLAQYGADEAHVTSIAEGLMTGWLDA